MVIFILGELELILKKRDAADHQFFRLEDGYLAVKDSVSSLYNTILYKTNQF